jgi:hypothetical protein
MDQAFLIELERFIPSGGTRHMLSTTRRGELEIRVGCDDWYRILRTDGVPVPVLITREPDEGTPE